MTYLDQLRLLRSTPQSVWMQFIGDYTPGCLDLYLFFEGQDDASFFQPYIRSKWTDRGVLFFFKCNGKASVLDMLPRVKPTLDLEWRALFFTDKDIDDLCNKPPVIDKYLYETECYSIENYLVDHNTLDVLWTDLLRLSFGDPRLSEVHDHFDRAYKSFVAAMTQVMAFALQMRRQSKKVNFASINLGKVIRLDQDCMCALEPQWIDHLRKASGIQDAFDPDAHAAVVDELAALNPKSFIRGKFDLWFLVKFMHVIQDIVADGSSGVPKATCSVPISVKTAIDIFSPRLTPPVSLSRFLDQALPN